MNKKELKLRFRDGINNMLGKTALIEQYNHATNVLAKKSDSLAGKPSQKELLKRFKQITEQKTINTKNSAFAIVSFNPYLISTTKSKLKMKVDALHELMREYNVK